MLLRWLAPVAVSGEAWFLASCRGPALHFSTAAPTAGGAGGAGSPVTQSKLQAKPADYSLAMKKAYEVSQAIQPAPAKEVGLAAGIPLSTYNRKVMGRG
jgi:hypothetical protein